MADAFFFANKEKYEDGMMEGAKEAENGNQYNDTKYANPHIASFLSFLCPDEILKITDGSELTAESLCADRINPTEPFLVQDSPESIGMTVPPKQFGIRRLSEIVGPHYLVSVIDVRHQEELEGWTLADLVEYFEDEDRLLKLRQQSSSPRDANAAANAAAPFRRRRRTAQRRAATQTTTPSAASVPQVLNQISLEFSRTALRDIVQSPKFVRDLDWIDHAWPSWKKEQRPMVQYYCLTSTAGCYTDFHVDFGGTSVWYHVLQGEKQFILIPPTRANLATYEDWLCRKNQSELFLPDLIADKEGIRKVSLAKSQTLFIPAGWIHAVYTPQDSLVFGGNFLHGLDMQTQMDIYCLEIRTRVQGKFRFPKFLALMMYTGDMYTKRLQAGNVCPREVKGIQRLAQNLQEWAKVPADQDMVQAMKEIGVEGMLELLESELRRVANDGICPKPGYKPELKKLRLKLTDGSPSPKKAPNSFRITLPSHAKSTMTTMAQSHKIRVREDLTSLATTGDDDDEWVPSERELRLAPKVKPKPKAKAAKAKIKVPKRSMKAPTTSRQRLIKRLK